MREYILKPDIFKGRWAANHAKLTFFGSNGHRTDFFSAKSATRHTFLFGNQSTIRFGESNLAVGFVGGDFYDGGNCNQLAH
jgi:hypothetical protein